MSEDRATEVTFVDHDDVPGLEAWARVMCRDTTVDQLALMLGVAPTVEAIGVRLGRTLPEKGAEAVARVCNEELREHDDGGRRQ